MAKKEENQEEYYEPEEFLEDVDYISAPTLKELRTKVLKKLDDGYTVETNPFLDTATPTQDNKPLWVQMVLLYGTDEEEA
jgi:hypothetical protein